MRKIKSHFFISLDGVVEAPNLLVHSLAVGGGLARLFPPDEPPIPLEPLRSEAFQTGVLNLSYGPAAPGG
jgi:hypothetical protein